MRIDRRGFLGGFLGGLGAAAGIGGASLAGTVTRLKEVEVTTLSDGNLVLPGDMVFDGLPEEPLAAILARHDVARDEVHPPCNLTLMRDGIRSVLFDAGSGPAFMPSAGRLETALEAAGLGPGDITHVVFTHGHPDHLWGVLDDFDDLLFANADYLFGQVEWDYWRDPATVDRIGASRVAFAVGAPRRMDAIAERCSFFTDGQEILPGVMAHAAFGHTPGHMAFEIRSGGEALMVVGDAIGNGHVAFEQPDWPSGSDQDADRGAQTRRRLLDQLATDRIAMIGFHLPGGGLGRVERMGDAYRFTEE
ncbi:MBL fold metallo-hydrolase [Pukyongiella litopenaei]|uniref:MBL fold metallo-hydrolase n=1 Tax=Pukyongiella litopenaei TaxID=2605946 RepID=A0A2S0MMU2_9RHOB|nr:MBL fold metallo-hydrolase [Pukyongiella litopenaei]AVO37147.1 MBL fold metallo-hydrolase [Pukyongiella litopenaei]